MAISQLRFQRPMWDRPSLSIGRFRILNDAYDVKPETIVPAGTLVAVDGYVPIAEIGGTIFHDRQIDCLRILDGCIELLEGTLRETLERFPHMLENIARENGIRIEDITDEMLDDPSGRFFNG